MSNSSFLLIKVAFIPFFRISVEKEEGDLL